MTTDKYLPISGREFPRFSAIKTFFRLPHVPVDDDYDIGIFGTPFDGGASYRPGARFAPSHIRECSSLGRSYHWTRGTNLFKTVKVADIGDCQTVPISLDTTYEKIEAYVSNLANKNKKFVSVGGDHSTTLPILRALRKKHGKPLSFIHFDAHLDTYPAAWGFEYHHGAFARHAVEEGLVDPKRMVQIGIRGPLADGSDLDFIKKHQITVCTMDDIKKGHISDFVKSIPSFGDEPAYLSFDIDCMDPAYAPGTGTPVPGGLTSYEVQQILRGLKIKNLVGADLVEISPPYDHADITGIMGVDIVFELLCLLSNK